MDASLAPPTKDTETELTRQIGIYGSGQWKMYPGSGDPPSVSMHELFATSCHWLGTSRAWWNLFINCHGTAMTVTQQQIIEALGVTPTFDATEEAERRINFLAEYLARSGRGGYVLGISGGVDSTVAGRLAQLAVERVRSSGAIARFHAVRLPYLKQHDESDAQAAVTFIAPDEISTVNIHAAVDALRRGFVNAGFRDDAHEDFVIGNAKARMRMVAQYALAGASDALVVGTDHAAEALMGFFTKFGDGAADLTPLTGLNKRRVRSIGAYLGVPSSLINKTPTADLENLQPQRTDEDAFGMPYDIIDDFLEGKRVPASPHENIVRIYESTAHKRALPVTPDSLPSIGFNS